MVNPLDLCPNITEFRGFQPAADYLSKSVKKYVLTEFVDSYKNFIQNRLASEVVEGVEKIVKGEGVKIGKFSDKPFFLSDKQAGISGSLGNSFALVKSGKKSGKLRMIISHTDVPCLKIDGVFVEPDAEAQMWCPGFSFTVQPSPGGGTRPEDWYGKNVQVVGEIYDVGKIKRIEMPGAIEQKSIHVEFEDKERLFQNLLITTGERELKGIYKKLGGMKDSMDFSRTNLYVFPLFKKGDNGHLIGNELFAFGHDDRSCLWASNKAFLESLDTDSENTLMVFGLDREEIGSQGTTSGYHGFFEYVLKETLKKVYGGEADINKILNTNVLGSYPAISADTDIGFSNLELNSSPSEINFRKGCAPGYGFFINSSGEDFGKSPVSPEYASNLISLFESNFKGKFPRRRFQNARNPISPDSVYSSGETLANIFCNHFPILDMGIPVVGLHNPEAEKLNVFDLYWCKEAYRNYLIAKD